MRNTPNIKLINENGIPQHFHDIIKDKTVILNMFYSHCQIKCEPLGKLLCRVNLLLNKHILEDDIIFVSITLDSLNDTLDDLNYFKNEVYNTKCLNWHFYTGKHDEIESLRYKLGMYSPEPEIDAVMSNHAGNFMIFNSHTGFIKHTQSFDNPIDIARKVIQIIPKNFYKHDYDLTNLNYDDLTDNELFENIHTMNSMFTVPFLPKHIRDKYDYQGELQRGFQYDPLNKTMSCCCKK
jgi:cytochrome oxidase Cu insertion factor (SCO1/SenC/PrrC family)